jgi:Amt family ammonium transporter
MSYGIDAGTSWFDGMGSFFVDDTGYMIGPTFTVFLSLVNAIVYVVPAGWLWGDHGFLRKMGVVAIAGSGGVHLVGGSSAFVAAWLLGPRLGQWDSDCSPPMGSPTHALIGLYMLWWGWLAFNAGSTFGVSGNKWRLSVKAFVTVFNGILGGLVGITVCCAVVNVYESLFIGAVGSFLTNISAPLLNWLKVNLRIFSNLY